MEREEGKHSFASREMHRGGAGVPAGAPVLPQRGPRLLLSSTGVPDRSKWGVEVAWEGLSPDLPQERTIPAESVTLPDIPIAGGGLFVQCPDPSRLGSLVRLRLLSPGGSALDVVGRVVWENAGGRNPFPLGMGVQLLVCPAEARATLRTLLEQRAVAGRPGMAEAWYAVRPKQPSDPLSSRRSVV
jgi:Tfp pilus assembly protein PilZ